MTRENFKGTCTLPHAGSSGQSHEKWWAHAEAHGHPDNNGERTMVITDPDEWAAHVKLMPADWRHTYRAPYRGRPVESTRPHATRDAKALAAWEASGELVVETVDEVGVQVNYAAPATVAALESGRMQVIHVTAPEPLVDPEPAETYGCGGGNPPQPSRADSPKPLHGPARKAWNRAAAAAARQLGADAHRALMARWGDACALRDSGAEPGAVVRLVTS